MNIKQQETHWLQQAKYSGQSTEELAINREYQNDLKRLNEGEPLAYVIGHVPFLNCVIFLNTRPLIPRPETEFWTEKVIDSIPKHEPIAVLDLCSGSGCIAVAIAKARPQTKVDIVEKDTSHHPLIKQNIDHNKLDKNRFRVIGGDLFSDLPTNKKYDLITANPPYIDMPLNRVENSVLKHEPLLALDGGRKGMYIINKIISNAKKYLKPKGVLWLEHEPEQVAPITTLATHKKLKIVTHNDQYKTPRYSCFYM